jgi:hypothetical protein
MNRYSKKDCVEEFLYSIRRAQTFTVKVTGRNVPKELKKYGPILAAMETELCDLEEKLFRTQWDKEDAEAAE